MQRGRDETWYTPFFDSQWFNSFGEKKKFPFKSGSNTVATSSTNKKTCHFGDTFIEGLGTMGILILDLWMEIARKQSLYT